MWSFSNSFLLQNGFVSSLQLCNCQGQYHKMYQKYQKYGFCFDKFFRDWSRLISIKIYMLCRIESKTLFIENDQCSTGFVCESSFPLHCQRPRANITWKGSLVKDGKHIAITVPILFSNSRWWRWRKTSHNRRPKGSERVSIICTLFLPVDCRLCRKFKSEFWAVKGLFPNSFLILSVFRRINWLLFPWNYQKTTGFLMISRGLEVN